MALPRNRPFSDSGSPKGDGLGRKRERRAVKTLVPGGQCYVGDQSGAGDGGSGVVGG